MLRYAVVAFSGFVVFAGLTGCSSAARDGAAVLAADTGRLNDEVEGLTRSRKQIEAARGRLTDALELSSLATNNLSARRMATWEVLQAKDNAYERRVAVLNAARKNADAATTRESDIDALSAKLSSLSEQARGQRSEQLTATAKLLASLSKQRSLEDELKFLSGFVKTVQDDVTQARKDAEAAAAQAEKKANEAKKKAADKAATAPTTQPSH